MSSESEGEGENGWILRALSMMSASGSQFGCALCDHDKRGVVLLSPVVDEDDGEYCRLSLLTDFDGLVVCEGEWGVSSMSERMLKSEVRLGFFAGRSMIESDLILICEIKLTASGLERRRERERERVADGTRLVGVFNREWEKKNADWLRERLECSDVFFRRSLSLSLDECGEK